MTQLTPAKPSTPSKPNRRMRKMLAWLLFFAVIVIGWFWLVSAVAPAQVDFSRPGGALAAIFTPPLLLSVLAWTRVHYSGAAMPEIEAALAAETAPVPPEPEYMPAARFRVGAWSALTPLGNASNTVTLTKERKTAFKPDNAIKLGNGNPAHASMVSGLKLDIDGYPANTRSRVPRMAAMLVSILNDLHSQQTDLMETIADAMPIYWMVPETIVVDGIAHMEVFAAAWNRSSWRDVNYSVQIVRVARSGGYSLLSVLQSGIDKSALPYVIVIAADSLTDAAELEPLQDDLFSDAVPNGFIPAEGAAGFLFFHPEKSAEDMWMLAPTLAPVKVLVLKDNMTGKDIAQGLGSVVASAIRAAQKAGEDVKLVVSDADHRAEGIVQITNVMTQELAHLDPLEQRLSPMEYTGWLGAATDLVHLALAVEVACADDQVVCAISNAQAEVASVLILPALV